jgi:hypothetical protein
VVKHNRNYYCSMCVHEAALNRTKPIPVSDGLRITRVVCYAQYRPVLLQHNRFIREGIMSIRRIPKERILIRKPLTRS